MTQVRFKQAAHICGKDYLPGIHSIPDHVLDDKFFLRLINAGLVSDPEDKAIKAESLAERNKRLADKIDQKKNPARPKSVSAAPITEKPAEDAQPQKAEELPPADPVEEDAEESDDKPSSKQNQKPNQKSKR